MPAVWRSPAFDRAHSGRGVTSAVDPGGDFFGEERLVSTLLALATSSPAEIGRAIEQTVRAFEGARWPHDDLSLILERVA